MHLDGQLLCSFPTVIGLPLQWECVLAEKWKKIYEDSVRNDENNMVGHPYMAPLGTFLLSIAFCSLQHLTLKPVFSFSPSSFLIIANIQLSLCLKIDMVKISVRRENKKKRVPLHWIQKNLHIYRSFEAQNKRNRKKNMFFPLIKVFTIKCKWSFVVCNFSVQNFNCRC